MIRQAKLDPQVDLHDSPRTISQSRLLTAIEQQLDQILPPAEATPRHLHRAMRHAVMAGGKRLRPCLLVRVAQACAGRALTAAEYELALLAGCAIELVHAASLVHDDLPSFDNAVVRRKKPTVHVLFGEPLAILTGDALIALSFQVLAQAPAQLEQRTVQIITLVARALSSTEGLAGGQSLECAGEHGAAVEAGPGPASAVAGADSTACSPRLVELCHDMKTAALFRAAAHAGVLAVNARDAALWSEFGRQVGLAFQLMDDLYDICGQGLAAGKAVGRDQLRGRPNSVRASGAAVVEQQLQSILTQLQEQVVRHAASPAPLLAWLAELDELFVHLVGGPLGYSSGGAPT